MGGSRRGSVGVIYLENRFRGVVMTIAEVAKNSPTAFGPEPEHRWGHFVFEDVTWEFYEQTLEQLQRAGQHVKVTFDNGRMEIMTTTSWHEGIKKTVARL